MYSLVWLILRAQVGGRRRPKAIIPDVAWSILNVGVSMYGAAFVRVIRSTLIWNYVGKAAKVCAKPWRVGSER